jgi:Tfp pilus assembly protein PilZ
MNSSSSKDSSDKRRRLRFSKRLETKFSSGGIRFTGISSNLSHGGLFIRTQRGFVLGTVIDIELFMPDGKISLLKGVVKNVSKIPIPTIRNGMGVELIEKDTTYINFLKSLTEEKEPKTEHTIPPEFKIITCPNCGVKNKVISNKLSLIPKCGRCGTDLAINIP